MSQQSNAAWIPISDGWRDAGGGFHVWRASVSTFSPLISTLRRQLTPEENARADRYFFDKDRDAFIVGRATARAWIGHVFSQTPRDVKIMTEAMGKPRLADGGLHFNVSHSGDLVLIGLCGNHPVGVDVEQIRPMANLMQLAERFFSAGDVQRLLEAEAEHREQAFYTTWTRKEAFAKAIGRGLTLGFQNFEITIQPDGPGRCVGVANAAIDAQNYVVHDLVPGEGYVGAAAGDHMYEQIVQWECVPITILGWLQDT